MREKPKASAKTRPETTDTCEVSKSGTSVREFDTGVTTGGRMVRSKRCGSSEGSLQEGEKGLSGRHSIWSLQLEDRTHADTGGAEAEAPLKVGNRICMFSAKGDNDERANHRDRIDVDASGEYDSNPERGRDKAAG
jgi:hypothetical protein